MYHLFQFTSIPLILPDVAYLQHFSLMQPLWGRLCQQSNKKEWDRGRLVCVSTWKLLCLQLTVKGLDQHWVSHFSSIWSKWCSKPRVSLWEGVARPHLHNEKYKISTSIAKMQLYRETFPGIYIGIGIESFLMKTAQQIHFWPHSYLWKDVEQCRVILSKNAEHHRLATKVSPMHDKMGLIIPFLFLLR